MILLSPRWSAAKILQTFLPKGMKSGQKHSRERAKRWIECDVSAWI